MKNLFRVGDRVGEDDNRFVGSLFDVVIEIKWFVFFYADGLALFEISRNENGCSQIDNFIFLSKFDFVQQSLHFRNQLVFFFISNESLFAVFSKFTGFLLFLF